MTFLEINDAYVSAKLAAALCGISVNRVWALIRGGVVATSIIAGRKFVSLLEVERATEGDPRDDRF